MEENFTERYYSAFTDSKEPITFFLTKYKFGVRRFNKQAYNIQINLWSQINLILKNNTYVL
jgi:hypothetical protein